MALEQRFVPRRCPAAEHTGRHCVFWTHLAQYSLHTQTISLSASFAPLRRDKSTAVRTARTPQTVCGQRSRRLACRGRLRTRPSAKLRLVIFSSHAQRCALTAKESETCEGRAAGQGQARRGTFHRSTSAAANCISHYKPPSVPIFFPAGVGRQTRMPMRVWHQPPESGAVSKRGRRLQRRPTNGCFGRFGGGTTGGFLAACLPLPTPIPSNLLCSTTRRVATRSRPNPRRQSLQARARATLAEVPRRHHAIFSARDAFPSRNDRRSARTTSLIDFFSVHPCSLLPALRTAPSHEALRPTK